jgi:hypothetical protein
VATAATKTETMKIAEYLRIFLNDAKGASGRSWGRRICGGGVEVKCGRAGDGESKKKQILLAQPARRRRDPRCAPFEAQGKRNDNVKENVWGHSRGVQKSVK